MLSSGEKKSSETLPGKSGIIVEVKCDLVHVLIIYQSEKCVELISLPQTMFSGLQKLDILTLPVECFFT